MNDVDVSFLYSLEDDKLPTQCVTKFSDDTIFNNIVSVSPLFLLCIR